MRVCAVALCEQLDPHLYSSAITFTFLPTFAVFSVSLLFYPPTFLYPM